jgi:Kef-type K+ transport system membrane component KefB
MLYSYINDYRRRLTPNQINKYYANEGLYRIHITFFGALFAAFVGVLIDEDIKYSGSQFFSLVFVGVILATYILGWLFLKKYKTFRPNRDFSFGLSKTNRCIAADLFSAASIGIVVVSITLIANGDFISITDGKISFETKSLIMILSASTLFSIALFLYSRDAVIERCFSNIHNIHEEQVRIDIIMDELEKHFPRAAKDLFAIEIFLSKYLEQLEKRKTRNKIEDYFSK